MSNGKAKAKKSREKRKTTKPHPATPTPDIATKEQVRRVVKTMIPDFDITKGYLATVHNIVNNVAIDSLWNITANSVMIHNDRNAQLESMGQRERKRIDETVLTYAYFPIPTDEMKPYINDIMVAYGRMLKRFGIRRTMTVLRAISISDKDGYTDDEIEEIASRIESENSEPSR